MITIPKKSKRNSTKGIKQKVKDIPLEYRLFAHAHLYYAGSILALTLFFLSIVQAIITHVSYANVQLATLLYFMAAVFLAIARRCHKRGKGHYSY